MDIKIQKAELTDIELLMKWSMRVLHEVFDISDSEPAQGLERANRIYYQSALQAGGHIACFACQGKEIIGCGGICLYQEMPSPDNLSRQCAYLMNIYTCPGFRGAWRWRNDCAVACRAGGSVLQADSHKNFVKSPV